MTEARTEWEEEFDKKFFFGVNCERCWGDSYDLPCRCDEDKSGRERGERIKSFLKETIEKVRREAFNEVYFALEKKARKGVYGVEINDILWTLQDLEAAKKVTD